MEARLTFEGACIRVSTTVTGQKMVQIELDGMLTLSHEQVRLLVRILRALVEDDVDLRMAFSVPEPKPAPVSTPPPQPARI